MPFAHRYCGLTIHSAFPLPELRNLANPGIADVTVRPAAVPDHLPNPARRLATYEIAGDQALLRLPGIAHYHVTRGGTRITVESAPRVDPAAVRLFLLHPVFALAALLRGDYLLNAAAVAVAGKAVAFVGHSATGKSSLAAMLGRGGFPVVSDSLLRITETSQGTFEAHPQAPWLLLWPDMVERLGFSETCCDARSGLALKRVEQPVADAPIPLGRIALLHAQKARNPNRFKPTVQASSLGFDALHLYDAGRSWLRYIPALRLTHFRMAAKIAAVTPIEQLDLPWELSRHKEMVASLRNWVGEAPDSRLQRSMDGDVNEVD